MANKLELTWYGKDEPIRVEPRLLIENTALSNTAADPDTQNMLIHGDNLLALKALESKFAGQVKCIYIDPPYNTGSAFEHYDDNLEHSQWLNLMRPRLEILRSLLSDSGSIWISIDDDEGHYERGWTIYRLAQESGLSQTTISNIFKRNNQPSLPTVNAICDACGITLAQFFTENDTANSPNAKSELDNSVAALKEDQREALAAFIKTIV